jgi:flagellin
MRRLSSGLRIASAADDAAGLQISERMRSQVRGLEVANRNIQDGISLLNTMDGALSEVHSILQRARTLAVQYNNLSNDANARQTIIDEFTQLSNEIARIEDTTNFNGIPLLQNALTIVTLQVGANVGDTVAISLVDLFGPGLNLVRSVTFSLLTFVNADITAIDQHITDVATARGRLGATSNSLEHTMNANAIQQENLMAAESRIRDADMAGEMTTLARNQIIQQAGMAALSMANQNQARVLDLLR